MGESGEWKQISKIRILIERLKDKVLGKWGSRDIARGPGGSKPEHQHTGNKTSREKTRLEKRLELRTK